MDSTFWPTAVPVGCPGSTGTGLKLVVLSCGGGAGCVATGVVGAACAVAGGVAADGAVVCCALALPDGSSPVNVGSKFSLANEQPPRRSTTPTRAVFHWAIIFLGFLKDTPSRRSATFYRA